MTRRNRPPGIRPPGIRRPGIRRPEANLPARTASGRPDVPAGTAASDTPPAGAASSSGALLRDVAIVAVATLALTWLLRFSVDTAFGTRLENAFWLRDYLGNLAVALVAFALIRRVGGTLLVTLLVVAGFQLANGAKLAVLGTPTSPDDFINVVNVYHLAEGWTRVAVVAILAAPVLALLWLTRWRHVATWATLATLGIAVALLWSNPVPVRDALDRRFGNSVWNQPENFRRRGLALHVVQESVRTLAKVGRAPSEGDVAAALEGLPIAPVDVAALATGEGGSAPASPPAPPAASPAASSPATASAAPRNVHVIVLESFFDPLTLGPEWVPDDPFPASLRALWAETGNAVALSPVFGGYTANAEFETLCGYPVTENAVFFEGWLRRPVPCLPRVLASAGYRTVASHPNVPGFWNRTHAYRLTGFDEYISKASFDTTDSVGNFLLDHSYYDQMFDRLGPLDAGPVFNYMLTYHGHLPYPNGENYPDQVQAGRDAPLLTGYLNHVWYKSRDLMERLATLRAEDPDGLIVVFGDHLPFLGPNYGVYDDVFALPDSREDFSGEQLERLVSTPLIVIDGRRGPLALPPTPLYRLPSLVLELLGSETGGMFDWTGDLPDTTIRPVYGMHLALTADGTIACPSEESDAACDDSAAWLARTRALIGDIFSGEQHALERLGPLPVPPSRHGDGASAAPASERSADGALEDPS